MVSSANTRRPRVAFALGSGAIRGLAHLGVLSVLSEAGVKPDLVVGSSAGALIGALFCIGSDLQLIESFASHLTWRQLADFTGRKGLIKGDKVLALLRILTKGLTFEDCCTSFVTVATDLRCGERVLIREGCLADAIRASISIPGIFCPYQHMGRTLVDGGLVGRVPVSTARELGADVVIGVDVNSGIKELTEPFSIFEVILQSIDFLQAQVLRTQMVDADIVIAPKFESAGPLELSKAKEFVASGKAAALEALPDVIRIVGGVKCED